MPARLARLTWMICVMGGSGRTAALLWGAISKISSKQYAASTCSSHWTFSRYFVQAQVVQPYSSTDTATAWKNSCFISSDRSDFHMVVNPFFAVHVFSMHMLTSFSVDEILLLMYRFISFRGDDAILIKTNTFT